MTDLQANLLFSGLVLFFGLGMILPWAIVFDYKMKERNK